ncbi:MAG: hypothetical protein RIC30_12840 [Marinoscillum sp.]|uniref:hypothetical protein n=1 Tax=Marinoscillum sp. TaxID=2024838 RepID=UPI00330044E6
MKDVHPKLIVLLISLSFVLGCKKEDIKKENQTNIVGTWLLNTTSKSNCDDPDLNGLQSHQCTDDNCTKYIFSSDSTGMTYIKEFITDGILMSEIGTYSVGESKLTMCLETEDGPECTDFKLALTVNTMDISGKNQETGCTEALFFDKEAGEETN